MEELGMIFNDSFLDTFMERLYSVRNVTKVVMKTQAEEDIQRLYLLLYCLAMLPLMTLVIYG